jgi:hypothetical protein
MYYQHVLSYISYHTLDLVYHVGLSLTLLSVFSSFPKKTVIMASFDPSTIANETYALAASSEPIVALVKEALGVIDDALDEYGYAALLLRQSQIHVHARYSTTYTNCRLASPDNVSLSFNGGKDCTYRSCVYQA